MDKIIHQVSASGDSGQETTSLTPVSPSIRTSETSEKSPQTTHSGGFLRSLFCCFTGAPATSRRYSAVETDDQKEDAKHPKAPLITDDQSEPEAHIVSFMIKLLSLTFLLLYFFLKFYKTVFVGYL